MLMDHNNITGKDKGSTLETDEKKNHEYENLKHWVKVSVFPM